MKWRVIVELAGADGSVQVHEVSVGGYTTTTCSPDTLGLTLAAGKETLAELQRHLVQAQAEQHCQSRRRCQRCGDQRPLKDTRRRRLTSLFGVVEVRAPRFGPCRCGVASRRTITPVAEIMPDRCTPEYERTLAKNGGLATVSSCPHAGRGVLAGRSCCCGRDGPPANPACRCQTGEGSGDGVDARSADRGTIDRTLH